MEVKIPLTGEEILASKLIPHEKYVHKWILGGAAPAPYDVALIVLESPSTYDHEFPKLNNQRCLEEPGSTFEVIGYGNTGGGRYPKEPRGTKLTISRTHPEFSHIFKASSKNSSVCDGDSGSPAIVRKGEEQILIGIVSYGPLTCEVGQVDAFTSVYDFRDWINRQIETQTVI
nr:unnamed protein product [Callosobruchus chinensis]